jgi:hypothetical protein
MEDLDSRQQGQLAPTSTSSRPTTQDWRIIALLMLLALGAAAILVGLGFWFR